MRIRTIAPPKFSLLVIYPSTTCRTLSMRPVFIAFRHSNIQNLAEAKIGQLDMAFAVQKYIFGLQVAIDDTSCVQVC